MKNGISSTEEHPSDVMDLFMLWFRSYSEIPMNNEI